MKLYAAFLLCSITGCATQPEKVVEIKVPVPVITPCKADIPKPGISIPKNDSRVEWLRSYMINHERLTAYVKGLEGALEACK